MRFLYDYAATISVAAVCCVLPWLYGGTIADALFPTIPWLLVFLFEIMLFFPQRHDGETTSEARQRVWRKMKSDWVVWLSVAFLALLLIPFFNKGLCPACDYPEIMFDGARQEPPLRMLPYCVNIAEHQNVTIWFYTALIAMVAVRHALLKRGKRMLLQMVVWNGVVLAFVGVLQRVTSAQAPLWAEGFGEPAYFFSTFGYPNMGGDYFTTLFAISLALWRWNVDSAINNNGSSSSESGAIGYKRFWNKHLYLVPAVVLFLSAMMTLSRASIVFVSILAVLFFIHSFIYLLSKMNRVKRVKVIAINVCVLAFVGFLFYAFFFGRETIIDAGGFRKELNAEISTLNTDEVLQRASGKGQYHVRVATQVWLDNMLFGCGGWGYKHFCIGKMTDEEFVNIQSVGGTNVHNDYLQFLCEHGIVSFSILVVIFVFLLVPIVRVWRKLVTSAAFSKSKSKPPRPIAIFALPGSAFFILLATLATLLHAVVDCPLRSPAILTLLFVSVAAIDGFLPKIKDKDE